MTTTQLKKANWTRKTGIAVAVAFVALTFAIVPSAISSPDGVDQRVEAILRKMTLDQKIDLIGGQDDFYIRAYPEIGWPRLRMADGPLGVRHGGPGTTMAGGISLAATWDPALATREGVEIARDARAKGVHFMLGPAVNIYRAPMNGRNFEYMGEDPYLAGKIAVGYIQGMQSQGVSATIKHFAVNNSEFDRHNTDAIVDERTLREIYLPAFEAAVKEGHVGSVMDSYNLINGTHATQNAHLNIDILKKEWGFPGLLMSDWTSTYDTLGVANGGMDLEMPEGVYLNRAKLLPLIKEGKVLVVTIDDKVRRIIRTAIVLGWLDREQKDLTISRYNREGDVVALQAAREGAVLLKNDNNILPLKKESAMSVLVVGPNAYPAVPAGGGSAKSDPFAPVSLIQGISDYLGDSGKVFYSAGLPTIEEMSEATSFVTSPQGGTPGLKAEHFDNEDLRGNPYLTRIEKDVNLGPHAKENLPAQALSSRWTGYFVPAAAGNHDVFVSSTGEDGGYYRLYVDDKLVLDDWKTSRELLGIVTASFDTKPHKIVLGHHGRSIWLGAHFHLGIARQGNYVLADAKTMGAKTNAVIFG